MWLPPRLLQGVGNHHKPPCRAATHIPPLGKGCVAADQDVSKRSLLPTQFAGETDQGLGEAMFTGAADGHNFILLEDKAEQEALLCRHTVQLL